MASLVILYTRMGEPAPSADWFKQYGKIEVLDRIETFEASPGYEGWIAYPAMRSANVLDTLFLGAEVGTCDPRPYMDILKKGFSTTPPRNVVVPKTELGMCLAALIDGVALHTGIKWRMAEYNLKDGFINFKYVRVTEIEMAVAEREQIKATLH